MGKSSILSTMRRMRVASQQWDSTRLLSPSSEKHARPSEQHQRQMK